jgi:hypothetical protein
VISTKVTLQIEKQNLRLDKAQETNSAKISRRVNREREGKKITAWMSCPWRADRRGESKKMIEMVFGIGRKQLVHHWIKLDFMGLINMGSFANQGRNIFELVIIL